MLLDRGRAVFDADPRECLASPQMQQVYFGVAESEEETEFDRAELDKAELDKAEFDKGGEVTHGA
jgi:hypothetical protein